MQRKRLIMLLVILLCGLRFTACDRAVETPVQLYEDIYAKIESECFGDIEIKQKIIDRFDDAGLSAVDSGNRINMVNWEPVDEFCSQLEGEQTIYIINDDGSYTQYGLEAADGTLHVKMKVWTGGAESQIAYQNEYDAAHWSYTEKGYLFFGAEHPMGDFGPWLETAIRVKPMAEELRQATEDYLMVLGYEDNNLFIENWNENDLGAVDLYDLYEVLTCNITAVNECVAATDFESVIQQYLKITPAQIRSKTVYAVDDNTYTFSSRTAEAKGSTPDMPHPEVAAITDNNDGTITLLVEAVWPKHMNDKVLMHEVTVRKHDDGFDYVSNKVIDKKMETSWYVDRY